MNIRLLCAACALLVSALGMSQGSKKPPAPTLRISPAAAAKIALRKFPGKLQGKPHLEHEDGQWQYEVLILTGKVLKEIDINAKTGKIGSVENTSLAEEAREAKAEMAKKSKKGKAENDGD